MEKLEGRTAVVTGAGSGIGRAIALELAGRGTNVVVADIEDAAAQAVAGEVAARGVAALAVQVDVGSLESVQALADTSFDRFGTVDILCNNAGVMLPRRSTIADLTYDDWAWVLQVNLWGVINGLLAFLPRMRAQEGEKHVVTMASGAGLVPVPGSGAYTASKFAAVGLSEVLAADLGDEGFGVTIVCPRGVATRIREAERNRPSGERGTGTPLQSQSASAPGVLEAEPVGRMVVDAIVANQLFLLTHDGAEEGVLARAARIVGND